MGIEANGAKGISEKSVRFVGEGGYSDGRMKEGGVTTERKLYSEMADLRSKPIDLQEE